MITDEVRTAHLHQEYITGAARLKEEIGYNPKIFFQMIGEHGPIGASVRLVMGTIPTGFTKLWEHERLSMTVEAIIILPWYAPLFEEDVLDKARRRLETYRFPVEAYLARAQPPAWAHEA